MCFRGFCLALAYFGIFTLSGCGDTASSLLARETSAGRTVASFVAGADTAVVLIYQPSDGFVCYGALQPWLEWRRRHPGAAALVFTRPPTASERTQLATYRIHADATLRPRVIDRIRRPRTPIELLLIQGRVAAAERIRPRTLATPLYRRLAGDPIAHTARPPADLLQRSMP